MGKIALLVSREEMIHQAHNILQEQKLEIHEMRVITTEDAVTEARRSIGDGAAIIIARGLQASLIKQYTDIPVVEIVMTAQEMALLIMRARQIVKKSRPRIAVVGFQNMFCDMSYFDELYNIELRTYYIKQGADLPGAARQAVEEGADLIIGGDTAVGASQKAGIPSLFLSPTEDSMRQAFFMAERLQYAMNVEKKTAAQIETLSDYSFTGVICLNGQGLVTAVNPMMEDIMGKTQKELKGIPIRTLEPKIGDEILNRVLKERKDYSLFLEWNHTYVFAVIAPVIYEEQVDGAMITCHRTRKNMVRAEGSKKGDGSEREGKGLPPLVRFEDIIQKSKAMQECVRLAGLYALSEHPVVIGGEAGTEMRMVSQCIHNGSRRSKGPFFDLSCAGRSGEEQRTAIFGERGGVRRGQGGTLLLYDVQELTADNQQRLSRLIRLNEWWGMDGASPRKADIRVMVTVDRPLMELMADKRISQELGYLLSGLELWIPPLRQRKEDLEQKIQDTLSQCCERYGRYHVLTGGAKTVLMEYSWKGNFDQIESFCERLILTAPKRTIDEVRVKRLLEKLYPDVSVKKPEYGHVPEKGEYGEPYEAARIRRALVMNGGNREKAAKELGISKATLWRRMKKYEIEIN